MLAKWVLREAETSVVAVKAAAQGPAQLDAPGHRDLALSVYCGEEVATDARSARD